MVQKSVDDSVSNYIATLLPHCLISEAGYTLIVFRVSQYFVNSFTKNMAKSEKPL